MGADKTDTTRNTFKAILTQEPRAALWRAQSTADEANIIPGEVVPDQANTKLALAVSGAFTAADSHEFRTVRGGYPGIDGCTLGYRAVGATDYFGADHPHHISRWEQIATDNLEQRQPSVLAHSSGRLIVATGSGNTTAKTVKVRVWDPSTGWDSWSIIHTEAATSDDWGLHPKMVELDDGSIALFHFTHDVASGESNVRLETSVDNGDTWVNASNGVLPRNIQDSTGTWVANQSIDRSRWGTGGSQKPLHLSVAQQRGQIEILFYFYDTVAATDLRDRVFQYASRDGGSAFEFVAATAGLHSMVDVVGVDGLFVVIAFVVEPVTGSNTGQNTYESYRSGSAFSSYYSDAFTTTVSPQGVTYGGSSESREGAIVASPSGELFALTGGTIGNPDKYFWIYRSTDYGETWESIQSGAYSSTDDRVQWWRQSSAAYPEQYAAAWFRDRVVVVCNVISNAGGNDDGIQLLGLGGHTNVTMPGRDASPSPYRHSNWSETYIAIEDLSDATSGFATAHTAPVTDSLATTGSLLYHKSKVTPPTGVGRYLDAGPVSLEEVVYRFSMQVVAGNFAIDLYVSDATNQYGVRVSTSLAATGSISVRDLYAVGTTTDQDIDPTARFDILVALRQNPGNLQGEASVWWQQTPDLGEPDNWTVLGSFANLTDNAGGTAGQLQFYTYDEVRFFSICRLWSATATLGKAIDGGSLADGFVNPTDLYGLPVPSHRPTPIAYPAAIRGRGGPGRVGDTYTHATVSSTSLDHLSSVDYPSPQDEWIGATGAADTTITYDLLDGVVTTGRTAQIPWGFYLDGLRTREFEIQYAIVGDLSLWNAITVTPAIQVAYERQGDTVRIDLSGSGDLTPWIERNELVDCHFEFSTTKIRRINRNTGGSLDENNTRAHPRVHLWVDDTDGTEPTEGTGWIWFKRVFVVDFNSATSIKAYQIKLRTSGTPAPPGGVHRLKKVVAGPLLVLGREYNRTTGTVYSPLTETYETRGGARRSVLTGPDASPMVREDRFEWMGDPMQMQDVRGGEVDPDYLTISDWSLTDPAYALHAAPGDLLGLVEQTKGNVVPVVSVPRVERGSVTNQVAILMWQRVRGALYGTIEGAVGFEDAGLGHEQHQDEKRIRELVIRELI